MTYILNIGGLASIEGLVILILFHSILTLIFRHTELYLPMNNNFQIYVYLLGGEEIHKTG